VRREILKREGTPPLGRHMSSGEESIKIYLKFDVRVWTALYSTSSGSVADFLKNVITFRF
jgi:hypothetical protein